MKPYTNEDLMRLAVNGGEIDMQRVIATYANPKNWGNHSCDKHLENLWVWKGPVICAYELASWVKP